VCVWPPNRPTCGKTPDVKIAQITTGMAWWYRKFTNEKSPEDQGRYEFAELEAKSKIAGGIPLRSGIPSSTPPHRAIKGRNFQMVEGGALKYIESAWSTARKKAGLPDGFHFHDLRHTFASHMKMHGVDDYTLMEIMGHQDFKMMQRYAHLAPAHKVAAIGRLPMWHISGITDGQGANTVESEGPQPIVVKGLTGQAQVFSVDRR